MRRIRACALPEMFSSVAEVMAEKADVLCEMDARMGDGDLGLTMKKGFGALPDIMRTLDLDDIGALLMKSGMKMGGVVPSTMGTLMAAGLMSAGKALAGKTELWPADFAVFLEAFSAGIAKRGKCSRGDRTLLDAMGPAAEAAALAVQSGAGWLEAADAAWRGARDGAEATRTMTPRFGKAAVHQAAAAGACDQGACAGVYFVEGLYRYLRLLDEPPQTP